MAVFPGQASLKLVSSAAVIRVVTTLITAAEETTLKFDHYYLSKKMINENTRDNQKLNCVL